jgi:hypothetical protein
MIREARERLVLRIANTIIPMETIRNKLKRFGFGSNLSQNMAGRKKARSGAAVDPINPKTISSGGLIEATNQVNPRMQAVVV